MKNLFTSLFQHTKKNAESNTFGFSFDSPKTYEELFNRLKKLECHGKDKAWTLSALSPHKLAEIAMLRVAKSDYKLGKKLLVQADISSICEKWALEAYDSVCKKEQEISAINLDKIKVNDPTFDFLVVHSGQAGTTAVQNFLSLHPSLIVTQKSEIDFAIENGEEYTLARKYRNIISSSELPIWSGIVQHGYVVGRRGSPEIFGGQPGPYIVDKLATITSTEKFYHLVRHPLEAIRSVYNHRIINQFAGGYSFPGSMNYPTNGRLRYGSVLSWPSSWEIPQVGSPKGWINQRYTNSPREKRRAEFKISKEEYNLVAQHCLDRAKYAAVGSAYGRRFKKWIPIDTGELLPGKTLNGLRTIFHEIGVNSNYSHPIFETLSASSARRAMLSNVINLTGLDHPLYVHLDYSGQALYSHTFPLVELATLQPNEQWEAAGFANQPISLVASYEQWVLQSPETRKRLLNEGSLDFILQKVAVPAWIQCHTAWRLSTNLHFIDDWQQLVYRGFITSDEIKRHLSADVASFLDIHPKFVNKWQGIQDVL